MKIIDKAAWHIDGGENIDDVILRFREVFRFLNEKDMLTEDGKETLEYGMDDSASLNSSMVNAIGKKYLDLYYDQVLGLNQNEISKNLRKYYDEFVEKIMLIE